MIIVTGASSSPGYKIALKLSEKYDVLAVYNKHKIDGINSIKLDITKEPEKLILDYKPDIIVHAAAIGNVDYCEENKELCYNVNVVSLRKLFSEAYRKGTKIIYISTDYVFDGKKGLYKETDVPNPINYYGLTKFIGEEIAYSKGGTVMRIAAVYGTGYGRINFGKFIVDKLSKNEKIDAAYDQYISPTLNTQIGEAALKLVEKNYDGLIHITGPRLSRYEFALKVCEKFGFSSSLVNPVSINSFNFKSSRPKDSSLDNSLGKKITGIDLSDIDKSLEIFKGEYYAI
jgi:dTDP-4-dehydrorhamnose reductase